jgi:hypothetical protein
MIITHKIQNVGFDKNSIRLTIDGKQIDIPLDKISAKLKSANDLQRNFYKISPSGYGIHWPLIDEDLSVDALLKIAGINN